MWQRSSDEKPSQRPFPAGRPAAGTASLAAAPTPARTAPPRDESPSVIGSSLAVQGEVSGEESLVIHGSLQGRVMLPRHPVTVGREGTVIGDIFGRLIDVQGKVEGNLYGMEQVLVRRSGQVGGNIVAPRVVLEDGAIFQGSIDMDPDAPPAERAGGRAHRRDREGQPGAPPSHGERSARSEEERARDRTLFDGEEEAGKKAETPAARRKTEASGTGAAPS